MQFLHFGHGINLCLFEGTFRIFGCCVSVQIGFSTVSYTTWKVFPAYWPEKLPIRTLFMQCYIGSGNLVIFLHWSNLFSFVFSFSDTDNLKENRAREGIIFIPFCHFHTLGGIDTLTHIFLQLCLWDFIFLITVHIINQTITQRDLSTSGI